MKTLSRDFYSRDTVEVAKDLLGKTLVRKIGDNLLTGIISETEAYKQSDDPASHAFRGITDRNKAMFGEVGRAYVYFTYGMHYCFNAVAKSDDMAAGAVLIRSLEPLEGKSIMKRKRKIKKLDNLSNGPAKLTQAFGITKKHYGVDLTKKGDLFIIDSDNQNNIIESPRIGIRNGVDNLWNFKTYY